MRSLPLLAALSATSLLLAATPARAADYTWVGDCSQLCSGGWSNPKAWSPQGVPGPDDSATIGGPPDGYIEVSLGDQKIRKLTLLLHASLVSGTVTVTAGSFLWTGGNIGANVVIDAASAAEISGLVHLGLDGVLTNAGTVTWKSGVIQGDSSAIIRNQGTWNTLTDDGFGYLAGPNTADFYNSGTFAYKKGGLLPFGGNSWGFHTSGVVQVPAGAIELRNGGNTRHSIDDGASFQGAGETRYTAVADGGASFVDIHGKFAIETGATVHLAHGSVIAGNGSFGGAGKLQWSAGELTTLEPGDTFTVNPDGNLLIDGDEEKSVDGGASLINQGSVIWAGTGPIGGSAGGQITNEKTWTIQNDSTLGYGAQGGPNSAIFANKGLLVKTGGAGLTTLRDAWGLDNSGTIEVQTGTLELTSSGNGLHTLRDGSQIKGSGSVVSTRPARTPAPSWCSTAPRPSSREAPWNWGSRRRSTGTEPSAARGSSCGLAARST
jgi:hypothetical protein